MFEERCLKLDLFALVLCALLLFLTVALLTYNPGDPLPTWVAPLNHLYTSDVLVYPPQVETTNACGFWGALVADLLFTGLGLGSYFLVASLAVLDVLLLQRRQIDSLLIRLVGWIFSLVGLTAIVSTMAPGISPGPMIGSGGYLGALASAALEAHFATAGGIILAFSGALAGLFLCTDYTLLRATRSLADALRQIVRSPRLRPMASQKSVSPGEGDSEEDDPALEYEDEDEDIEEVAIRIRGKRVEEPVEEEGEEEEEEGGEVEEDEEEECDKEENVESEENEKQPASFRTSVAQALGIHRKQEPTREQVMEELEAASLNEEPVNYALPTLDLLQSGDDFCFDQQKKEVRRKAKILEQTFDNFGFKVKVVEVETGPVIAQYEVELEAGLRLSRITGLADDLAIALRVPSVRIVAPIPGKNTVGIEVPNEQRQLVRLREVMEELEDQCDKMRIPLFLGKDVSGNPLAVDLSTLPHLLIAGRTGTGKSVCLNAIISSILMTRRPDEVRMLMIDPKMVELSCYKTLPHLMHPVVTDMRKAEAILAWAVEKMEERYELLARAGVRHVSVYNQLGEEELVERLEPTSEDEQKVIPLHLPFIVIVADEMADLMLTSGKEVEQHIIRLAQKSRAVGIHLILATQKPTVDVITGLIKSNLPARIAFQVASRTDSRVVLDEMGADKLLGNGDMLFLSPGTSTLLRGQGTYLNDDEIDSVVDFVSTGEQHFVKELVHMKVEDVSNDPSEKLKNRDDLYEVAVGIVVQERRGSVSLLQRALGIGYGRAARLIDFMAEDGIVGAYAGSQAREVLITDEQWALMQNGSEDDFSTDTASSCSGTALTTASNQKPIAAAIGLLNAEVSADPQNQLQCTADLESDPDPCQDLVPAEEEDPAKWADEAEAHEFDEYDSEEPDEQEDHPEQDEYETDDDEAELNAEKSEQAEYEDDEEYEEGEVEEDDDYQDEEADYEDEDSYQAESA
ncbi:MAG: DNA translocase FtsK [Planctomycetaceae bacterium]|nr:DNA translocase FtsK [Planctomycetaceae bacterium]